jgi:Flp pilus assembly protein TadD
LAYSAEGERQLAIDDYTRVIEINPLSARAYNSRGYLYSQMRKTKLARDDYRKAMEFSTDPALTRVIRGRLSRL